MYKLAIGDSKMNCTGCKYYKELISNVGECRRYAPRPGEAETYWPGVRGDDWCGEYISLRHYEERLLQFKAASEKANNV